MHQWVPLTLRMIQTPAVLGEADPSPCATHSPQAPVTLPACVLGPKLPPALGLLFFPPAHIFSLLVLSPISHPSILVQMSLLGEIVLFHSPENCPHLLHCFIAFTALAKL